MVNIKFAALLFAAVCLPLAAQQDNWCTERGWHSDGMVTHHEVREEHLAAAAQNVINPAQNGSIHVHGWSNSDILVKACVQSSAHDSGTAESIAKQVTITDGPGRVVAKGPSPTPENSWWSVSYDVWVPSSSSLELQAYNGSIRVEDTLGQIRAHSVNGSMTLKNVGGNVDGETTNGSLSIDLAAGASQAKELKLKTNNGSIHLQLPSSFNADVEASTVNGSVRNDFAEEQDGKHRSHNQKFTIGAGGSKIEADTINGSVHISRQS